MHGPLSRKVSDNSDIRIDELLCVVQAAASLTPAARLQDLSASVVLAPLAKSLRPPDASRHAAGTATAALTIPHRMSAAPQVSLCASAGTA
jgi:hypothetical protein